MSDQSPFKTKRFLVFAGENYYPLGGWKDLVGSFDTLEECETFLLAQPVGKWEWNEIVDLFDPSLLTSSKP